MPGIIRLLFLVLAAALELYLLISLTAVHARAFGSDVLSLRFGVFTLAAIPICLALHLIVRVVQGRAHPLAGAGRLLAALLLGPLFCWFAVGAGPHAAADMMLLAVGFALQSVLVGSAWSVRLHGA